MEEGDDVGRTLTTQAERALPPAPEGSFVMANEVESYLGRAKTNVSRSKKAIIKRTNIPDQENDICVKGMRDISV